MRKPLYITTTLPYVNADPHIGFALEIVHADIFARYRTLQGDDVFFNTGTDEHGQKIYEAAQKAAKKPQEYADEYAAKFRSLKEQLGLSEDLHFVRTTDQHHVAAAQEIWRRCADAGDIEKRTYKGLYCVGDEAFMKESDLVNGRCPNHPTMDLVELEEENYFFKLSNYQDQILQYLSQGTVIVPEWRRQEAITFVQNGLEDFSISRVKEKMPWGIPVPGDDSQVMYVWFDALTNYISTLGWPENTDQFEKYWGAVDAPNALQVAGKDQVRFQSIMWQGMLMSAGLPATKRVIYHGFITSGGQKMSKSLGNVIDPLMIVNEYGTDALRYFLARHVHPFDDTDVTMEKFKEVYNADLANGLGNFVARVMKLSEQYLTTKEITRDVGFFKLDEFLKTVDSVESKRYSSAIEDFDFTKALEAVWLVIAKGDEMMTTSKVFQRIKTEESAKGELVKDFVQRVWRIAVMLEPFMPTTSDSIKSAVTENKKPENLFPRKE